MSRSTSQLLHFMAVLSGWCFVIIGLRHYVFMADLRLHWWKSHGSDEIIDFSSTFLTLKILFLCVIIKGYLMSGVRIINLLKAAIFSTALRNDKEGRRNITWLIESSSFCFLNLQRLERLGALEWTKVVDKHQGWRLITCIWLHAGIIHLLANMLSLVFIGIRLEQQFGFVRIGVVYLLSGFGGSLLSSLFIRNNISVGASGALFGLLGSMLSELITNWSIYTNKAAALLTLLFIIAINLAIGILPHVDNFAHVGGFLSGFLLGFVLLPRPQYGWPERRNVPSGGGVKSKYKAHQYVLWLVSVVLLIVGFTVALVMLFKGENGNDRCHWCHYLSCVPTSRWKCNDNNL